MKVTAIVGSYHRNGIIDSAVDEILAAAERAGAEVRKFHLLDCRIEFCRNCQECAQTPGTARGTCPVQDDLPAILDAIEASDGLVLASPMNFWTVTALMKRFVERLICYAHWPWDRPAPTERIRPKNKHAIVVVSCAAPAILARLRTGAHTLLRRTARLLGAGTVDTLFVGFARHTPESTLHPRARARAARLGRQLAQSTLA